MIGQFHGWGRYCWWFRNPVALTSWGKGSLKSDCLDTSQVVRWISESTTGNHKIIRSTIVVWDPGMGLFFCVWKVMKKPLSLKLPLTSCKGVFWLGSHERHILIILLHDIIFGNLNLNQHVFKQKKSQKNLLKKPTIWKMNGWFTYSHPPSCKALLFTGGLAGLVRKAQVTEVWSACDSLLLLELLRFFGKGEKYQCQVEW